MHPIVDDTICLTEKDESGLKTQARYDFYRIYDVELNTEEQFELFKYLEKENSSVVCLGRVRQVGQIMLILVAPHRISDFAEILHNYNVKHELLSKNFQEKIDLNYTEVLPIGSDVERHFNWQHFFHLETIYAWLDHIASQFGHDVELQDMGTSTLNVPIKGIKIKSTSPTLQLGTIFIQAGIHAYEWIGPAVATYIIHGLLTSLDPAMKDLKTDYNWVIFPCINPDGYKYSFEYDRMWRKNRKLFDISRGVDLNRNYPTHWQATEPSDPSRYDYEGRNEGSELETQRVMTYIMKHIDENDKQRIKAFIALDSLTQTITFPFGYTIERVKNYDDLKKLGKRACQSIKEVSGYEYTTGSFHEIFPSAKNGYCTDWAYEKAKIHVVYNFGLRKPLNIDDVFLTRAEEIMPTAKEAFLAIQSIAQGVSGAGLART